MKKAFILFLFFSLNIIVAQTSDRFSIKSIDVNTRNNEFGAILTSDGSIFYSKSTYDNNNDFNEKSANLYKGVLETKGQFSKGLKFPTDATHAVFTNDGRTVYYSKKSGNKKFQLYRANIDHTGRWKNNIKLPFNNPNYTFKQPALNTDNTKLFFASDLPGSFGKTDIYYVNLKNHGLEYSDPINLGENVNTQGTEIYPFIGKKDKLFFSSDSHNSTGGLDIFESFYEEGSYTNTSNLEIPINSVSDDFAYVLIPDSNKGYLSSNRKDGFGGIDIYYFEDRKPSLNKCSQAINGVIKNKKNQKTIFEASVEVFSTQDHMGTVLTNFKGEFIVENVECNERYDIVSYKEGYNGFAEVQTVPENGKLITLYLDPEFPEGFEEEFDLSNEMVVYDTETNAVIKTKTDIQKEETNSNLSFAEQREQDRIKKENIKREQIEAEKEAERIEAQKKEAIRIAAVESQRVAAEKDKQERIAKAKAMAEKLRLEKEAIYIAEDERIAAENLEIEAERIEKDKVLAEQQKAERLAFLKENKERIEAESLAQIEFEKQERIKNDQIAQAEVKKQAKILAQKQAVEKERLDRIALAKQTAENIRKEKELAVKVEEERIETERIAKEKEEQDNIESVRIAQLELENKQRIENDKIAQTLKEQKDIDVEKITALESQKLKISIERSKRIALAQETANRLRNEQIEVNTAQLEANHIEEKRLEKLKQTEITIATIQEEQVEAENNQTENQQISETLANQRKNAEKEREERIALAKKTAKKLRDDQIIAEKETLKRQLIQQEKEKRIADAETTAEKLRSEKELIAEQTSLANLKEVVDKERLDRITQARVTAEKLRKEQIKADKTLIEAAQLDEERLQKLAQSETSLLILEEEQSLALKLKENEDLENLDEDAISQRDRIDEERATRISQAMATAEKLRNEQIQADKAKLTNEILIAERQKQIAEAQKTVLTLERENLESVNLIAEQQVEIDQTTKEITDQKQIEAQELIAIEYPKESIEEEQTETAVTENLAITSNTNKEPKQDELVEAADITNLNPERCARNINGVIQSSGSFETLAGANVDLYFDGQNIETATTDEKGEFHFYNVDCDTKYTLISFKKDYNNIAKAEINTESVPDIIVLLLDPDPEIFIEQELIQEEVIVEQAIKKTETNKIDKTAVISEIKDIVITTQKDIATTSIKKPEIKEQVSNVEEATLTEEEPTIIEGKILINPIYFDLDEYYLTLPARRELDKIIITLRQNPTMIIESGSHTDTRGNFDYNLILSEKRSQEAVGYLVANGSDPDRISGRGYGESMPVNHCFDGVKCSDSEHLENRRTEFIILRY